MRSQAERHVDGELCDGGSKSEEVARQHGDRLPYLALAYLVTGEPRYLDAARGWMDRAVARPTWGSDEDLGAAHLLFGMAVAYDWLYGVLPEKDRARYRAKMAHHADILWRLLVGGRKWWARDLLQNHNYVNAMAIAVAGVALLGEADDAGSWLAAAKANFDRVTDLLSPDGASHEGVAYWGYALDALLKYRLATQALFPEQDLLAGPHFRNAPLYRLHTSLPGFRENANYADSPTLEWYGPGYLLRALAGANHDGLAQWLADRISAARGGKGGGLGSPQLSWLDLLWYAEAVPARPPAGLPTSALFENLGIYVSRSDWSDGATWFLFKAGPPQGRLAADRGIVTGSHIHPDAGHFTLWADGDWIVVDDGYVSRKRTENHNVLRFDGVGQLGEGSTWFDKRAIDPRRNRAQIVHAGLDGERRTVLAELAGMYPAEAGVARWTRTVDIDDRWNFVIKDTVTLQRPGRVTSSVHTRDRDLRSIGGAICLAAHSDYALTLNGGWERARVLDRSIDPAERRKSLGFYEGATIELSRWVAGQAASSYSIERRPECRHR